MSVLFTRTNNNNMKHVKGRKQAEKVNNILTVFIIGLSVTVHSIQCLDYKFLFTRPV